MHMHSAPFVLTLYAPCVLILFLSLMLDAVFRRGERSNLFEDFTEIELVSVTT